MLNTNIAPWPCYSESEIAATVEVLKSGRVNQWTGSNVTEFEKEFAEYIGVPYAVAVSNGTVALDIILNSVNPHIRGGEIIVTSRTYIASVSAIVMAGAVPIFADVDRDTQNITIESIREKINANTRAIICVHLAGLPCDMQPIMELAAEYNLCVIEDCAQAHGAVYKGHKVGSIGHAASWSFCQDKIMSVGGEGGMITTNDKGLWENAWSFKDHGKSPDKVFVKRPNGNTGFRYVHDSIGSNYRMTEIQAAIGRLQLKHLDSDVAIRNFFATNYDSVGDMFSCIRIADTKLAYNSLHAKYKHYMFVNVDGLKEGWDRDRILFELNQIGVPCYTGSCSEVYLEKAFDDLDMAPVHRLPIAKELGETSLMFLVHPTITHSQLLDMMNNMMIVFNEASKEMYDSKD